MNLSPDNKITALVITLNEERNIQSIIDNLNFTDEIIIVDSFSGDRTVAIAESNAHVKVVQNVFKDYPSQRNFAISLASHPWILFLDADERIPDTLREEICQTVADTNACEAYYFYRKFMFNDKPLHFSGWQTDKNIRLFKKDFGYYNPERLVHEKPVIKGKTGSLTNKLIHFSYTDYGTYKSKMEKYGKLKALELLHKNFQPNWFHFWAKPAYKFLYSYLFRLGILDGKKGIIICYLNAYSIYVRFKEVKLLQKTISFSRT